MENVSACQRQARNSVKVRLFSGNAHAYRIAGTTFALMLTRTASCFSTRRGDAESRLYLRATPASPLLRLLLNSFQVASLCSRTKAERSKCKCDCGRAEWICISKTLGLSAPPPIAVLVDERRRGATQRNRRRDATDLNALSRHPENAQHLAH